MSAANDLVMPKLGLTMTEGVLSEWRVKPGDRVSPGDVLFIVETDKIANEIEAPGSGEIIDLLVEAGETVPVGTPLARWSGEGSTVGEAEEESETKSAPPEAAPDTPSPGSSGRIVATPLARRRARQQGVDLATITGSGPRGRIKAADVDAKAREAPAAVPAPTPPGTADPVAISAKHHAMVARVSASKREVPHFYLSRGAEISPLDTLRAELNAAGGQRITVTHLLLKALGRALLDHPEMNRIWLDDGLVALSGTDVGMVVDTADGLVIPVVRNVAAEPLDHLAATASGLVERAREGRLGRAELEGGAVSLSNIGMTATTVVAPIISPPQAAILGVGAAESLFRPDTEGRPVLRREIRLTLSCDHRVAGGMQAARFLDRVAELIEAPHTLLRTL